MNRRTAVVLVLSYMPLKLIAPASASPEELSPEEIESECWNTAVLSNIPLQKRDAFIEGCIDDYQDSLRGRIEEEFEYAPPDEPENSNTPE